MYNILVFSIPVSRLVNTFLYFFYFTRLTIVSQKYGC